MKKIALSLVASALLSTNILADDSVIEEFSGQLRAGYINLEQDADEDQDAIAVGGHLFVKTKSFSGISFGAEIYTVQDMGINDSDKDKINGDFFDEDKEGYSLLSQAYIEGKYKNTTLKIGRQIIDTPHADSDDIRMIPNYFLAYLLTNNDIKDLTIIVGNVSKMAGWENGVDASRFVDIDKILGLGKNTDGIYLGALIYEGVENLTLQGWYYKIDDVKDIFYLEAGYDMDLEGVSLSLGVQGDFANDTGDKLAGEIDQTAYGISLEAGFENGLSLVGAYNWSDDDGASESFGGGPFFTSMEDQTLDAIGEKGDAYLFGIGYDFENLDIKGLNTSLSYGKFEADRDNVYDMEEIDFNIDYEYNENLSFSLAYANIEDKINENSDYDQFRAFIYYNF